MPKPPIIFEDFVIPMTADGAGHIVLRVGRSPVGETQSVVCAPESLLGRLLAEERSRLGASEAPLEEAEAEHLGQELYDALFQGPIQRRFLEALGRLGATGTAGLRIKLQVDFASPAATALQSLPWELLYRAETGIFLALHGRLAIVRHLSLPTPRERPAATGRAKLLVAMANPSDRQPLASVEECRKISAPWRHHDSLDNDSLDNDSLNNDSLDIHYLPGATLERLRNRLMADTYQGLHFIGHGEFDAATGEGRLVFEDTDGRAAPCRAKDLAVQLADHVHLRWVVLNACSSGRASFRQPFGGLATALLQTGIPALLAMQQPVSDEAAILFSQSFYRRLAAGDGVEAATSEGRLAVRRAAPHTAAWAAPVLFLRSDDGQVLSSAPAASKPRRPRRFLPQAAGLILLVGFVLSWGRLGIETTPTPSSKKTTLQSPTQNLTDEARTTVQAGPPSTASSRPSREPVKLREGETVEIPALDVYVSVTFDTSYGTPFARLVVTHRESGEGETHAFMGPDHWTLTHGGRLAIQQVDWGTRSVTLIPAQKHVDPAAVGQAAVSRDIPRTGKLKP